MAIEIWAAFALATCILLVIPGPTILTVISYSIAHGRCANIPLVAAVALGDSTALILSIAGLGALLSTSAWMFTAVKWVGGLYLIYLGIKLILASGSPVNSKIACELDSQWKLFGNTWLVTALNPKGIIFFIAFLPQFVNHSSPVVPQLLQRWMPCCTQCSPPVRAKCCSHLKRKRHSTTLVAAYSL